MWRAELLDSAVLQNICTTIADKTGCAVAIMGQQGRIIASSNLERIGLIHPGAARILNNEVDYFDVTQEMARQSDLMLEGRNLPVELDGVRIASVGVNAPLAESRKYSAIVQTCVTAMLENELGHLRAQVQLKEQIEKQSQTQAVLSRSEKMLREMAEMAKVGYWHWNVHSGDVEWSEQVYRIFDVEPEQFKPHIESIQNLSPWPEDHQRDKELIQRAAENREPGNFVQRFLLPDGSTGYYSSTFQGIYDTSGQLVAIEGVVQDITELRRTHLALEQSESRFRDFADSAADWFWEMGPDLRFTYLTGRVEEVMGVRPEQITGKNRPEIYRDTQDFASPDWQGHLHCLEAHQPFSDFEVRWTRPDGGFRYISLSGKPYYDDQASFLGYRGVGRDITKRKQQEHELLRLRNYLVNIIDSMPSVLIGVDEAGNITQWNKEAQRVTGIGFDEALGRPLVQVFPRMSVELEHIEKAISTGEQQINAWRSHLQDGEMRFEDVTIYPLNSNGVDGAVIRLDDVTEQVRLEEMMIQTEKMLSLGGLAAGMAHEINNPLAGIMQTANVMKSRLTDDRLPANRLAAQRAGIGMSAMQSYFEQRDILRMLDDINASGGRVAEIVENMLGFARKSDTEGSLNDLAELIDKTLVLAATDYDLKKQRDFKTIEIIRDYAPDLPAVYCEWAKMQQVLLNILRNGAEAMQHAKVVSPTFTLRTVHDPERDRVCLEIGDNGPGMVEETRKRVFEPFFTTKPVGEGTGLGLSVSYFIVTEIHNGEMRVESAPGKGTRFVIQLPAGAAENGS